MALQPRKHRKGLAFACIYCEETFRTVVLLDTHELTHVTEEGMVCPYCPKRSFWTSAGLKEHVGRKHTKLYRCAQCGKSFGSSSARKRHQGMHTREKSLTSDQCNVWNIPLEQTTSGENQEKQEYPHVKKHQEEKEFTLRHQGTHTGEKSLTSDQCNVSRQLEQTTFGENQEKPEYPNAKKQQEEKEFTLKCRYCLKGFRSSSKFNLAVHERTHTGEKSFASLCTFCGRAFASKSAVRQHERIHTGEKPFKCKHCGKAFNQSANMKAHETLCNTREKTLSSSDSSRLALHEKTHHTRDQPFVCTFCGKSFSRKFEVQMHERRHTGEKPFKCAYCYRCFACIPSKKSHEQTHTGEKPLKCAYCDKCFSQHGSRKSHERSHTGEKPFKCNYCQKGCITAGSLKEHERIHTGEKPFKCNVCSKQFRQSSALSLHKKKHNENSSTNV